MANDSRRRDRAFGLHAAGVLLALTLAFAGAARAQDDGADEDLIARCSEQEADDAVGIAQLEAQCPGLEAALIESGYAALISETQRASLTVHGLVDLRRLVERYRAPRRSGHTLEPDALASILRSLQQEQAAEKPLGWYGRLKRWLRDVLFDADDESGSWLSQWLDDFEMSPSTSRGIFYGAVVLVILLAIAVLGNELRAAGFFRGRGRTRAKPVAAPAERVRDPLTMTLSDLEALPLHEQPSMLLRMVAAQLMKAGRLRSERNLTHRELARSAVFQVEGERTSFTRVAGLAERLRYGQHPVPSADIEEVMRDGRALSARLRTATGSAA